MIEIPGGLFDSTRRPRQLRVVSNGDWYLAAAGRLDKVGFGELALADLQAVSEDLGRRIFIAHPEVRPLESYLGPSRRGFRRVRLFENQSSPPAPTLAGVARGAQVAVLPDRGPVWVDAERLFRPGEEVPLPWTDPPVTMTVVRPRELIAEMKRIIGPDGPKRALLTPDA